MALPPNSQPTASDINPYDESVYVSTLYAKIYKSVDSEKNYVEILDPKELVVVLGKGLGEKSTFLKIRKYGTLNDPNPAIYYVKSSQFVMNINYPYPQSSESSLENIAEREGYIGQSVSTLFDNTVRGMKIKDAELNKPYKEGGRYNIVLDTGLSSKSEIESNFENIQQGSDKKFLNLKYIALKALTDYYGKKSYADEKMMNIANNEEYGYLKNSEPYFSTRPGKHALMRFSIEEKYLQIFEDIDFAKFSTENIHKDFIACNIKVNELGDTVENLTKVLEKYHKNIYKFSGEVDGLNLKDLSNDLRKFLSQFKKYLSQNQVVVDIEDSNKLELGFNIDNYRLEYVLYYDPYGRFMKIGMNGFCKIFNVKISKLLINYKNILSASMAGMGWMDFIKEYFAGEFKINFVKSGNLASNTKKSMSQLKEQLDIIKSDFEELSLMIPEDASSISRLKKDDKFMEKSSELLIRSKDMVGDNFLIDLPNILANVEDLDTLYALVFNKVSVKDLVDIMVENLTENLSLPDLNEVKIRGVIKTIKHEEVMKILSDILDDTSQTKAFLAAIMDNVEIDETFLDKFVSSFGYIGAPTISGYLISIDSHDGEQTQGIYGNHYEGDLIKSLVKNGVKLEDDLTAAIADGSFQFSDYYQPSAVEETLKEIFTTGLIYDSAGATTPIPISTLKIGIYDFLKKLDNSQISNGIDSYFKARFKESKMVAHQEKIKSIEGSTAGSQEMPSDLVSKLTSNKKIKFELDKLSLTKKKLLKKIPGINIDLEDKKLDATFTIPSIKKVNPSFDFSKFQFGEMGDIFGSAVESIEKSLKDGIENALVSTFKDLLNRTLESINKDTPDIVAPDYGGINMNDMLDATNGFGADIMSKLALSKVKTAIEKFDPTFCEDALDISGFQPNEADIKTAIDDMSMAVKPLELIRMLKGQKNKKDYNNMMSAIQNKEMKQVFTEDLFNEVMDIAADFADLSLLEEIENAYDDKEVLISVCENAGISYCRRNMKEDLRAKYPTFTDEEICEMIENMVDDVKDSIVDSIGNLKEDHDDNLPFNEDPCSFMPKPSAIDPLSFINDMAFNSIFDPIEVEYKSEAAVIPDLFLIPTPSEEYIPLYYYGYDQLLDISKPFVPTDSLSGLPEFNFISAQDTDAWLDDVLSNEQQRLYNQNFSNYYFGLSTPLYSRSKLYKSDDVILGGDYIQLEREEIVELGFKFNSVTGNWQANDNAKVYVRNSSQNLKPIPEVNDFFESPAFSIEKRHLRDDIRISAYFSGNQQKSYVEYLSNGDIRTEYSKINMANPIIECSDTYENRYEYDSSLLSNIKGNIESINSPSSYSLQGGLASNLYSTIANIESLRFLGSEKSSRKLDPQYGDYNFYHTLGDDSVTQISKHQLESKEWEQKPLPLKIIAEFVKQLANSFAESPLLETKEMLAFIIDDEDVSLLKVQDAKNSAKAAFSESCGFEEDDKSLKLSSIKKLIYLNIRIHVIEKVIRNCFMYSVAYPQEADDAFVKSIWNKMDDEMSKYPNNYYNNVFKKNYSESYNQSFDSKSTALATIVKEIYSDIKKSFDQIFRKNRGSILENFLSSLSYDFDITSEQDMISLFDTAYENHFNSIDKFKMQNNSRFVIQRALRIPYKTIIGTTEYKELQWGAATLLQKGDPSNAVILKLCYLFKLDDRYGGSQYDQSNVTPSMMQDPDSINENASPPWQGINSLFGEDFTEGVVYNFEDYNRTTQSGIYRLINSTSHEYAIYEDGVSQGSYFLLPLAVHAHPIEPTPSHGQSNNSIAMAMSDKPQVIQRIVSLKDEELGIYQFLEKVMRMDYMIELISSLMETRVLFAKPAITSMFSDSKSALRNSITSMHQDSGNYAYQENETSLVQLDQASEISTNPEFSMKASKMALMTVPLIIKGMAELFDPNIKIASNIRRGFQLTGIDIPPPVASLMAMPVNIIPMAPGPPITPLGLLYLSTSFLEPKERKRLSDLLRGKNLNSGADQETGTFADGTLEEQRDAAVVEVVASSEEAIEAYESVSHIFAECLNKTTDIMKAFGDEMSDYGDDTDIKNLDQPNDVSMPGKWELRTDCSNYSYTNYNSEFGLTDGGATKKNSISKMLGAYTAHGSSHESGAVREMGLILGYTLDKIVEEGMGATWENWANNPSKFNDFKKYLNSQIRATRRRAMIDLYLIGKVFENFEEEIPKPSAGKVFRYSDSDDTYLGDYYNKIKDKTINQVISYADSTYASIDANDSWSVFKAKRKALKELEQISYIIMGRNNDAGYIEDTSSAFAWLFSNVSKGDDSGALSSRNIANNRLADIHEYQRINWQGEGAWEAQETASGIVYYNNKDMSQAAGQYNVDDAVRQHGYFAKEFHKLMENYEPALQTLGIDSEF